MPQQSKESCLWSCILTTCCFTSLCGADSAYLAVHRWPMGLDASVRCTGGWACWGSPETPDTFSSSLLLRQAALGFRFLSAHRRIHIISPLCKSNTEKSNHNTFIKIYCLIKPALCHALRSEITIPTRESGFLIVLQLS